VVNSIRPDFIDPSRTIKRGLLELDRRHAANDASVYPLFYTQGATFWAEVDNAIRTQSASSADLDGLIPDLLRANPEQGGHLPRAFVAKLRTILGARADELLARYVGD
jgi:predicted metalloprotease with PDZ domain